MIDSAEPETWSVQMPLSLAQKVAPSHAALVVVDVQNDYCHPKGQRARVRATGDPMAVAMVPNLRRLIEASRRAGVRVIWVRTENDDSTVSEALRDQRSDRPAGEQFPCFPGSWGAEFYEVFPLPGESIVTKHRYSAFINTNLDLLLRVNGIKTLIMTGVSTNACVESTARDGFMHDYHIVMVEDCCAAGTQRDHEAGLYSIRKMFGVVERSEDVIAAFSGIPAAAATAG